MFRLMGLQVTETPTLFSTGASDHLVQQLECALGGAWIAITKPEIGIDDPDQVEFGKMMALGNELSTDDEIEAPRSHVIELLPQSLDGLHEVAGEHQAAGLGKQLRGFLLESFDPWSNGRKAFGGMTIRAFSGWRDRVPTVVTDKTSLETMIDQPGVAIRTLQPETARTTQCQRGVTAAIEKQQCLFASSQRNRYSLGKAW
jgi:hypothetical protein